MHGWHYGKGMIYFRSLFRITKLAFLRVREKRYPFRAEPQRIGHYSECPPPPTHTHTHTLPLEGCTTHGGALKGQEAKTCLGHEHCLEWKQPFPLPSQ